MILEPQAAADAHCRRHTPRSSRRAPALRTAIGKTGVGNWVLTGFLQAGKQITLQALDVGRIGARNLRVGRSA